MEISLQQQTLFKGVWHVYNTKDLSKLAVQDPQNQGRTAWQLEHINACRLYLKAFNVSDLTLDGRTCEQQWISGKGKQKHSGLQFPDKITPSKYQWEEWS